MTPEIDPLYRPPSKAQVPVADVRVPAPAKHPAGVYLTEAEFSARYLNGARRTAQRWRVTGDGPPFVRLGPRRIAYRETDCERWAEGRTFRSRADELARQAPATAVPPAP